MVSKILLVVLIGCTAVLASPIDLKNASTENEKLPEADKLAALFELLKEIFGKLLGKIFSVIFDALKKVFNKILLRLESKEFGEAVAELQKIVKVIFNEKKELKGDAETKEIIQKQLDKVGESFQEMLGQAIENVKENNGKTVDASEFKNAVDELKQLVDKLYHK